MADYNKMVDAMADKVRSGKGPGRGLRPLADRMKRAGADPKEAMARKARTLGGKKSGVTTAGGLSMVLRKGGAGETARKTDPLVRRIKG